MRFVAPIVVCLAAGYVLARAHPRLDQKALIAVVLDVLMPALVFDALYRAELATGDLARVIGATVAVVAVLATVCVPLARLARMSYRAFTPPVLFMNSGFVGIPLMMMVGGPVAATWAVTYDQVQTVMIFTVGIALLAGRGVSGGALREMGRSVILWAIAAAVVLRVADVAVPAPILSTLGFLGAGASPVALLLVGVALRQLPLKLTRAVGVAVVARLGGGLVAGLGVAALLGLDGSARQVVVLLSALPSAVYSYVLAYQYDAEPAYAASTVVATTAIGLPLVAVMLEWG